MNNNSTLYRIYIRQSLPPALRRSYSASTALPQSRRTSTVGMRAVQYQSSWPEQTVVIMARLSLHEIKDWKQTKRSAGKCLRPSSTHLCSVEVKGILYSIVEYVWTQMSQNDRMDLGS
jgi:hypothetical protein